MIQRRTEGFTLIEIGIVVPILMVIALGLFSVMFSYLLSSNREQVKLYQAYSQSSALDRIETDVRLSTSFLSTQDTYVTDPYGSNQSGASWNFAGSDASHRVLLLREYSTGDNPASNIRTPVYQKTSSAPNCSLPQYIVGPLSYNIVYFVSKSTLYKRVLINSTSPSCSTQYQKLSCPSLTTLGTGSRNSACGANDEVIAQNVTGFALNYYADQTSNTALNVYTSPSLISSARSVGVSITSGQNSYNGTVSTSSSLRTISQNSQAGQGN